ncbi:UDP-glucuronosyltransferase 2C1-like isoform X2 [Rhopalosiphum maidis]|uniref:UDP-glucuronosyltransferase 2C1-like isoform X2 n=1 Tax=Rhopalosiphum maidis TaxID=43146 RepID=UPI000EFFCF3A|nr:UDP-glucuronosyltransferase 2C1-like isoform X2 [Rhopalosiphum maidis]
MRRIVCILYRMNMLLLLAFLAVQSCPGIFGARILAVEPHGSKSHWQYMKSILDLLSTRHQVTVITPLPAGDRENYTEIDASQVFPVYPVMDTVYMIEQFGSVVNMLPPMPERSLERDICDAFFDFGPIRDLLRRGPDGRYDVVLLEPFYSPCLSYLAHRLCVPEIYAIPSSMITPMEMLIFGTEPNPSYVPNLLYNGASMDGFAQRLANVALFAYVKIVPWLTNVRMMYREPKSYDVPEVRHKPLLVFINTHFITESPRPFPVNMIQIGGIHLRPPGVLPDDILEFIENSSHGVIFFTFGSVSSMSTLPKHIKQTFIEAFAKVPQRVLWKYDGEINGLPENIMTKKWFPQRDILLHPNIKLFISHGGISGVYEAVDAGVPVLGFPLYYDQPRNVGNLVEAGMALSMDLLTVNKIAFLEKINELINNKNYSHRAKIVSKRFKDRPVSSSEMVNYWFDYVLRHNGAYHLNSKALKLTWYQYLLLDIIIVVVTSLIVFSYFTYILFHWFQNYTLKFNELNKKLITIKK